MLRQLTRLASLTFGLSIAGTGVLASETKSVEDLMNHLGSTEAAATGFLTGELSQKYDITEPSIPDLSNLVDADGNRIDMDQYLGKVVVVNFWATWCAPCKHEMPTLNKAAQLWGDDGLIVIAASIDSRSPKAAAYLKKESLNHLTYAFDAKMKALRAVDGIGVPYTIVVDKQGMAVGRLAGTSDWANDDAKALFAHYLQIANDPS